jgi:uncharacterized membrane protein YhaH (DUF805 family)
MFRNLLHRLPKSPARDVMFASFNGYARRWWTTLAFLALVLVIIGLDNMILDDVLPSLPDQLGAEDSTLRWIERAKAIAVWSQTAAMGIGIGPLAGGLLLVVSIGTRRVATRDDAQVQPVPSRVRAAETVSPV